MFMQVPANRRGAALLTAVVLGAAILILLLAVVSFSYGSLTFSLGRTSYMNSLMIAETGLNQSIKKAQLSMSEFEDAGYVPATFPSTGSSLVEYLWNDAPGIKDGDMKMLLQEGEYAIGVGKAGTFIRAVRVQYDYGESPDMPAAIYMSGTDVNPKITGAGFKVDGNDYPSLSTNATGTGDPVNGIGVVNEASLDSWIEYFEGPGMDPKAKKIEGAEIERDGEIITTPNIDNVGEVLDTEAIAEQYRNMATLVFDQDHITSSYDPYNNVSTWGTPTAPEVVWVQNDVFINGNVTGTGVLVIDGNFIVNGTFRWEGLVVVMGDFTVGSGSADIWGGMLVSSIGATVSVDIGGNFSMRYSTEALGYLGNQFFLFHNTWEELK